MTPPVSDPKVSIVVPTYAPGDRIDGLVRSLEKQTLPASEFEVIFVDDGSPDDTWQRLQRIRDRHRNVRIERIENSGWPSRPRNVGLDLARGEYVLFMDHDDQLYPRALEAGYATVARTHADVLNGKETRTDQSKWALETYEANADNVLGRTDVHPLIPTNPHKLFRREFLLEHGIRFPEGRRVLWEDVFFNLDVARHASVVSTMADTPFYHWVRDGGTASSSYGKDLREFWRWVREIVVQTNDKLAGDALRGQWQLMLAHQYRSRVLAPLAAVFRAEPDMRADVRDMVAEVVAMIPPELDDVLTPTQLGRAVLLRAGRWDLLERYVEVDAGLVGLSTTTSVEWDGDVVRIAAESRWRASGTKPLALRFDGDRVVRDLPADIAAELPDAALDMTAALSAARTGIAVRARDSAVVWMLPGSHETSVVDVDGRPDVTVTATATLDPQTAAFGRPLDERSWDLSARNELVGTINQRGLRTSTASRNAVFGGHVYVVYRNKSGMLALDIDQKNRSLVGSAPPDLSRAVIRSQPAPKRSLLGRRTYAASLEVPFARLTSREGTVIDGRVTVGGGDATPARIETRADGAWLVAELRAPRGTHPLALEFHGRSVPAKIDVVVDASGAMRLVPAGD